MRLDARIEDDGTPATPVLVFLESPYPMDVVRGVAARKGHPEKIAQVRGRHGGVITEYDHHQLFEGIAKQLLFEREPFSGSRCIIGKR